ncbi:MAG TPA: phosphoribosylanthranilate isomerase [Polyangiaceae bacterium]
MRVKICGITTLEQAWTCVELGVDAIGVNLVESSPRRVDETLAARIAREVGDRVLVVAVVANRSVAALREIRAATGVGCLQLHGDEPPADVAALLPHAYKAVRVGASADVAAADAMPGDYVMVDARVEGALGGTGRTVDWALVAPLAKRRKLVLAGGLTPENVRGAIAAVRPWCVDVASGVESAPGVKDAGQLAAFVRAARGA